MLVSSLCSAAGISKEVSAFLLGEKMKTVAIVGMATTNRDQASWENEDVEIWTLNESPSKRFGYIKRVTRHFQLHPLWNCMRDGNQNDPEHNQWLRVQNFPIYMQDKYDDIPSSVKYPLDEVFDKFQIPSEGKSHWREFDSTFPYMLALALYEEFDRIEIYGFEMGSETEYAYQRPNVHLWLGIARGLYLATGKPEIYIPPDCALLGWDSKLYGYEMIKGINPMEIEIDRNKFGYQAKKIADAILEIEGRQKELKDSLTGMKSHFDARAREIIEKKTDEKLKQRRLTKLSEELEKKARPLQQRIEGLHKQKIALREDQLRNEGAHLAARNWLNRYNSQGRPDNYLELDDSDLVMEDAP